MFPSCCQTTRNFLQVAPFIDLRLNLAAEKVCRGKWTSPITWPRENHIPSSHPDGNWGWICCFSHQFFHVIYLIYSSGFLHVYLSIICKDNNGKAICLFKAAFMYLTFRNAQHPRCVFDLLFLKFCWFKANWRWGKTDPAIIRSTEMFHKHSKWGVRQMPGFKWMCNAEHCNLLSVVDASLGSGSVCTYILISTPPSCMRLTSVLFYLIVSWQEHFFLLFAVVSVWVLFVFSASSHTHSETRAGGHIWGQCGCECRQFVFLCGPANKLPACPGHHPLLHQGLVPRPASRRSSTRRKHHDGRIEVSPGHLDRPVRIQMECLREEMEVCARVW